MNGQPTVRVGITTAPRIALTLQGCFLATPSGLAVTGTQSFAPESVARGPIKLIPAAPDQCSFTVGDVQIGRQFHWQRTEAQTFRGTAVLTAHGPHEVTLVNVLPVEDYLCSVISSEMSADAGLELLKAHAVISRSWLMAQIQRGSADALEPCQPVKTADRWIQWWDHADHGDAYDVCADDHCQRYQGITRQTRPTVAAAVAETTGQVLTADGSRLCDARFSKCCGGVTEEFQTCWQPVRHSYLQARRDLPGDPPCPDLSTETAAEDWTLGTPDAFCRTSDPAILNQVLNDYDRTTTPDFYRWTVTLQRDELRRLVARRLGRDIGFIRDLVPVERGRSGRLSLMEVAATEGTVTVGKELAIRRLLSESHLLSSAFVVERRDVDPVTGVPASIVLHGAGWGHGVGLCQIGAAMMASRGYDYCQILAHYYPGAILERLY